MTRWSGIDEFHMVAQVRSFTQAAQRLGMSASQVSREVAQLENRLLYRSTRRVSLTEAGEQFLQRCRRLIEDRDEALATLLDATGQLRGLLRITCPERFIVPMINRFMLEHPLLAVEVLLANEGVDLVEHGIDMAIRIGRQHDSGLVATRLGTRRRRLCAAPSYLQARGTPAAIHELTGHDCVCGLDELWSFTVDRREQVHQPAGRFRCNAGYAVVDAALAGLGLCQLPDFYLEEHLQSGRLVELLPESRPPEEDVWAVYAHRRHVPLKVRLALEHLQHAFRARTAPP
jgi:DNA-binding transcriptional LysR family regulator